MNSGLGGRTGRRRTMELLAQAYPASLNPDEDPGRRQDAIAAVLRTGQETTDPGATTHRRRPRVPRAALGAGLTLAAAGTAAVVFVVSSGPAVSPAPTAGSTTTAPKAPVLSAQQILLTAAVSAARQPSQGRYWRVSDVSGSVESAGPNAHPYAIYQRWAPEVTWDARSPRQRSWDFPSTGYTSTPATAGAAAVWRAEGSPQLPSQHRRQQAWYQYGGTGYLGNASPTFAQIQRLPSSPAALAAAVQKAAEQQMAPVPPGNVRSWSVTDQQTLSQNMFGVYDQLLKLDPITPAVRAAVFRDLAHLPGVRSIGQVTDPLGRTGYGIAQSEGKVGHETQHAEEVLIIAPGSGLLLSDEFVVTGTSYSPPPSGAAPGLASCPKGTAVFRKGTAMPKMSHPVCKLTAGQARHLPASEGRDFGPKGVMVVPGPVVEQAPGQVQSYDTILSAGWTNASPPLSHAQRFSVAQDSKG